MQETLIGHWLGVLPYSEARLLQDRVHAEVRDGIRSHTLLMLEHQPVITAGRRGSADDLLVSREQLARRGVDFVTADRGGLLTFHGPGQLVAYPLVSLKRIRLSLTDYMDRLLAGAADCMRSLGIDDVRWDMDRPGLWTADRKIGSVGVRLREGVSLHGMALNLTVDLDWFNLLRSCGHSGRTTNLAEETGARTSPAEAAGRLLRALAHRLDLDPAVGDVSP
jgi:lipoate-protein ligase B